MAESETKNGQKREFPDDYFEKKEVTTRKKLRIATSN